MQACVVFTSNAVFICWLFDLYHVQREQFSEMDWKELVPQCVGLCGCVYLN